METLRHAKVGSTVRVVKLHGEGAVKRRIMDMGITKGVEVYIRKLAPLGDPIEVTVRGYELSIRKAGTIILLSTIVIWAGSRFGWIDGVFRFDADMELEASLLGKLGGAIRWIFAPLGFGSGDEGTKATIATIMGLVAKEEVVGVFGVLDFAGLTKLAGYSFLIFNLLCAPCFAAIGAIRREMNSAKWTWFAIAYQCVFAYTIALIVYQLGMLFAGGPNIIGVIAAVLLLGCMLFLLFRPCREATRLTVGEAKRK